MQTAVAAFLADDVSGWFGPTVPVALKRGFVAAAGLWLVSVLMTAFAILAVTENPHQQSVTFFGDITKWKSVDAYRDALNTITDATVRNDYVDQIYICSIICGDKHWYIKRGIWLFLGSIVTIEVLLVVSGVSR
jgi:hypothetical protein